MKEIKDYLIVGNANLYLLLIIPSTISINTIHNLDLNDCSKSYLKSKITKNSFITVDAYRNNERRMFKGI